MTVSSNQITQLLAAWSGRDLEGGTCLFIAFSYDALTFGGPRSPNNCDWRSPGGSSRHR